MKEFRRLAFKGVADKLENPSHQKQGRCVPPQVVNEDAGEKHRARKQDGGNANSMAEAVHRVLVAGTILRDPLRVRPSAQHAEHDSTISAAV